MRLIDLRPSQTVQPFPLVVMALGDSETGCTYYRTSREYDDTSMQVDGLEIVFASEQIAGGEMPDGLTVESLLAICEDQARNQAASNSRMHLIALQLQAARRALATEESNTGPSRVVTGSDSKGSKAVDATARIGSGESLGA